MASLMLMCERDVVISEDRERVNDDRERANVDRERES